MTAVRPAAAPRGTVLRATLWDFAHLAVLTSFALAQPLFDLIQDNPEFLAARGALGFDVVSFAVLLVVLPPALLLAVELLGGLIDPRVRRGLHLAFVAILVALIAVLALKRLDAPDAVLIALATTVGIAAAVAYARAPVVRSFMNILSAAPVVFLALFVFLPPVSGLAFPRDVGARSIDGAVRAPIVVVLFDELPLTSLLDDHGRVDAVRYPAFAELERSGTWFRNAYAVYDSTEHAQPAIMDGDDPVKDALPIAADHPDSVFTLFGKTHRMNVSEEATSVCPRSLCRDPRLEEPYGERMSAMASDLGLVWLHKVAPSGIEARLPSVSETWGNFTGGGGASTGEAVRANLSSDRKARFDAWVRDIAPGGDKPQLSLKHTLLPHVPWQYLPDAKRYGGAEDPIPGLSRQSYRDATQVESLYQRHVLQLGFADHELGLLLAHLKRERLFDKSLIVVTADHGVAFQTGKFDRRTITRDNAQQIASIPLFIKAPGQRKGRVDDAYAETVDVLPTMFDILHVRSGVRMDGRSAFSPEVRRRRTIRIFQRGTFRPLRFSAAEWERGQAAALEHKLRLFGVGRDGPLRLFRVGPHRDLLSRRVRDFPVQGSEVAARFVGADEYRRVNPRSSTVPAWVTGHLDGVPAGRDLAVAVNGRIAAVTKSFHLATATDTLFAVMVAESSFRAGRNRVELFELRRVGAKIGLTRLGTA